VNAFVRGEEGQGVLEFALVLPPILLLLVFGLVELSTVLSAGMTMAAASREGARVGSALANGGNPLGCGAGQSPNAATVDSNIVAAVERVLTDRGDRIRLPDVQQIQIWKADAAGQPTAGLVNVWNYSAGAGPVVDGQPIDFVQASQPWQPCSRFNGSPSDSVGVTIIYTYNGRTPLRMLVPMFNQFTMSDKTVMALNATK
jgi:hypothetical protein